MVTGAVIDRAITLIDRARCPQMKGFFHKLNIYNRERRHPVRTSPVKLFGVDFDITVAVNGKEVVVNITAEKTKEAIWATCHTRFSLNKEKKPVCKIVKNGCYFPGMAVITGKLPASVTITTLQVDIEFLEVVFGSGEERVILLDQSEGIFQPSLRSLGGLRVFTQVDRLTAAKLFEANYSKDCKLVLYADCDLADPPDVRIHI